MVKGNWNRKSGIFESIEFDEDELDYVTVAFVIATEVAGRVLDNQTDEKTAQLVEEMLAAGYEKEDEEYQSLIFENFNELCRLKYKIGDIKAKI